MKARKVVAGILLVAYPVAVHWAFVTGQRWLTVPLLLSLVLVFAVLAGVRVHRAHWVGLLAVAAIAFVLIIAAFAGSTLPVLLLPSIVTTFLCFLFARTLIGGRTPLITRFAQSVENDLPSEVIQYTARLTLLWSFVFALLATEGVLLAAFASEELWSLFANFLNYVFVLALFVIEYGYRRWRFRHRTQPSFVQFLTGLIKTDWTQFSRR